MPASAVAMEISDETLLKGHIDSVDVDIIVFTNSPRMTSANNDEDNEGDQQASTSASSDEDNEDENDEEKVDTEEEEETQKMEIEKKKMRSRRVMKVVYPKKRFKAEREINRVHHFFR